MQLIRTSPGRPSDATLLLGGVSAVLLIAARFVPFQSIPFLGCTLKQRLNVPCPSCGMTRAFQGLAHGDLHASVHVSPLGMLLAFGAVAMVIYAGLRITGLLKRGVRLEMSRVERKWVFTGAFSAIVVNWAYLVISGAAN